MSHLKYDLAIHGMSDWTINGKNADSAVSDHLDCKTSAEDISEWTDAKCPYCNTPLAAEKFLDVDDSDNWDYNREYLLRYCLTCAHWQFNGVECGRKCMDPVPRLIASSIVARFATKLPEGCSEELAQQLRRNPLGWHDISPKRMETFVADIFRANYRHCHVRHVGKPGDMGVDVIFIDGDGTKWLVQVKRRTNSRRIKSEGFSALQSILGTLVLEGEHHGIVVSTADYFSHQAKREQQRASIRGYTIKLMDKSVLGQMIGALLPRTPWRGLFDDPVLRYIDSDVRCHFLNPELGAQLPLFHDLR